MKQDNSRTCFPVPGGATNCLDCTVPYLLLAVIPLRTEGLLTLLLCFWYYIYIRWKSFAERTFLTLCYEASNTKNHPIPFAASVNFCNVSQWKKEMPMWWFQGLQSLVKSSEHCWCFPKRLPRKMLHMSRPSNSGVWGVSGDSVTRC